MKNTVEHNFFNYLHLQYLQPQGFKKSHRTFSREQDTYTERFHFYSQGDGWYASKGGGGDGAHHKVFQLYVGVEFLDLPATLHPCGSNLQLSEADHIFPHTHWFTRIETIAPTVIDHRHAKFKLFESTKQLELIKGLSAYFGLISEQLAANMPRIRREYVLHQLKVSGP